MEDNKSFGTNGLLFDPKVTSLLANFFKLVKYPKLGGQVKM